MTSSLLLPGAQLAQIGLCAVANNHPLPECSY
jgi:hypothetical protein